MAKNFKEGDSVIIVGFYLPRMSYCLGPTNGIITSKRRKYFTVRKEDGEEVECQISTGTGNHIGSSNCGWMGNFKVYSSQEDFDKETEIPLFLTAEVRQNLSFEQQINAVDYIKSLIEKTKKTA